MSEEGAFLSRETGIILAADVAQIADVRRLAELGAEVPEVVGLKVGFTLALRRPRREASRA